MAGIFKANNPFNTFLLFVYGILLRIPWYYNPTPLQLTKLDGFLYKDIFPDILLLKDNNIFFYHSIVYLFLFTQAVIFNRWVVNQRLMQKASYLPGMSYLLLTALFSQWNQLSSVLIVNTLLIWGFSKMNKLYNTADPKVILFNIGCILSISSFLYVPSIAFIILLTMALLTTRPVNLREWTVAMLGLITPYYFLFFKVFLSDDNLKNFKFPLLKPLIPMFSINRFELILAGIITFMLIIGVYFVFMNLRKQVVQVRKSWTILLFFFLTGFLISLFYSANSLKYALITIIPLSACMGAYFFYPRSRLLLIISHWLMVAFIVYTGFFIK